MPKAPSLHHPHADPPSFPEVCAALAITCVFVAAIALLLLAIERPPAQWPHVTNLGVFDLRNL